MIRDEVKNSLMGYYEWLRKSTNPMIAKDWKTDSTAAHIAHVAMGHLKAIWEEEKTSALNEGPSYDELRSCIGEALGRIRHERKQVGGDHYKDLAIQPVEYIQRNNIGYMEGSAIKYLTRWKSKGGIQDLEKAKHFIEMLIEFESTKEKLK